MSKVDAKMAHIGAKQDASIEDCSARLGSTVCLRSRPCSSERDSQVRAVKCALQSRLGPYERVLTYLQSVLVWEKPVQCVLLYAVVNVVFWWVPTSVPFRQSRFCSLWCDWKGKPAWQRAAAVRTHCDVSPASWRRGRWLACPSIYRSTKKHLQPICCWRFPNLVVQAAFYSHTKSEGTAVLNHHATANHVIDAHLPVKLRIHWSVTIRE